MLEVQECDLCLSHIFLILIKPITALLHDDKEAIIVSTFSKREYYYIPNQGARS